MAYAPMTFGEPASCRARPAVPLDVHTAVRAPRDLRLAPPPARYGSAPAQPVGPAGEHAGAEGRVELVPGEARPSRRPSSAMSTGRCGASCAASSDDAGAVPVRGGGQSAYRPQLAGDVRRAGDAHQRRAPRAPRAAPRPAAATACCGVRGASRKRDRASSPRHGSSDAWCSVSKTKTRGAGGQRGGQQVQRVGGGPGEDHLVVRAAAEEVARRWPGSPRTGRCESWER